MDTAADETLSPIKRAYLALERAQQKINALQRARSEPIAIVGMACRFPGGADSPDAFWRLLAEGVDAVGEIPPGRWDVEAYYDPDPAAPGKMYTRRGGFLREPVDQFDPQVFGISPREADSIDPQQRLLLELAWEALESAAQMDERLAGSSTGVFIGITSHDYADLLHQGGLGHVGMHTITGTTHNAAAGRLSYVLGFNGPCLAVDTACSSSLAALHTACGALLNDECRRALVGGVNLMLSPMATIALSQGRVLAPDGICRAFDKAASGMVRGEGGAVLLLKRLSAALEDGDTVHALIRGSAVNQDGPSSGLTVPNGPAQEALIRRALAHAQLKPDDIDYIEAHGTGTPLGDPIELQALGKVFGAGRDRPLWLGSVKTNIGHLEACSGLAGLIKTVLALRHGQIPPHLHFTEPTPHLPWDTLPFSVSARGQPWPGGAKPRLAGVSSFGFSGVNAHVIVQEAPATAPLAPDPRPLHLLALSARSEAALRELALRYQRCFAQQPDLPLACACHSANSGRVHASHRLAVLAASTGEAASHLAAFLDDNATEGVAANTADAVPKLAFLFTGQGSQAVGMGRELYDTQPLFRQIMDQCDALLRPYLPRPLLEVLYPAQGADSPLDQTVYAQPALFALEYALAQVWMSWGVKPSLVIGHSLGEYAAACVAGVFSLEDGLKLVAQRAALMQSLPKNGAMAAVFADAATVLAAIQPYTAQVSIAAYNSPQNIVISGQHDAVAAALARLQADGFKTQALNVSHAFHSPLVEPILDRFEALFAGIKLSVPQISLVSNVDGQIAGPAITTSAYWRKHLREPVRFREGLGTVLAKACTACVEIGPKPTLLGLARQLSSEDSLSWLPSLRPGLPDWRPMLESLSQLYLQGLAVDWAGFGRGYALRRVALPTYPFQRRRYWLDLDAKPQHSLPEGIHPLLGSRIDLPDTQDIRFASQISLDGLRYLDGHRVFGAAVLPAAAYLEIAVAAAAQVFGEGPVTLENIVFQQTLTLSPQQVVTLHLRLTPDGTGAFRFSIHSKDGAEWKRHASGRLLKNTEAWTAPPLAAWQANAGVPVDAAEVYRQCEARGIGLGPSFQAMRRLWALSDAALGELALPDGLACGGYHLHPVLLDGALQVMGAVFKGLDSKEVYLPVALDRLRVFGKPGASAWSRIEVRPIQGTASLSLDVSLLDAQGRPAARLEGLQLARVNAAQWQPGNEFDDWLYEVEWQPMPACCLPDAARLRDTILPAVSQNALAQPGLDEYGAIVAQTEILSAGYIIKALRELGWTPAPGALAASDALASQLGIADRHRRLFGRLLEILAEDGLSETAALDTPSDLEAEVDRLLHRYPAAAAELTLLRRCGNRLAEILAGRCDPLGLLFPPSEPVTAATLYGDTPAALAANGAVRDLLASLLQTLPAGQGLRVLEIGAGTGGTTAKLLPVLPAAQTEYTFTDISPLFVNLAAAKFADYPFVRRAVLDIEQDPASQGFASQAYDLIVAANVLHATADLAQTLAHTRQLLAPGGVLVLLEGTAPLRFIDLTFGLLEGWWRFNDFGLRPKHPLLSAPSWKALLEKTGFEPVGEVAAPPEAGGLWSKQALLVAKATPNQACAGQRWLIVNARQADIGLGLRQRIEMAGGAAVLASDAYRPLLQSFSHIAYLSSLDAPPPARLTPDGLDQALDAGCAGVVACLKAALDAGLPQTLWLATCQAQRVLDEDRLDGLAQAPVWGLGKAIALEYPGLACQRIDLETLDDAADALFDAICLGSTEDQIALRQGRHYAARLARRAPSEPAEIPVRADGCYLITGGLRGLGLETAAWLVAQGAKSLVLTGRHAASAATETQLEKWRGAGVQAEAVQADVSDAAQMAALLARIKAGPAPLRGVIHSAGQLDDGSLAQQDKARFKRVFAAKVFGAWQLHQLTLGEPLDFFVLYSSMAALLGSAGQANHAAANSFLDMLAHYRRQLGLPGLSVNWGAWSDIGAAAGRERSLQAKGMGMIAPRQGIAILARLLAERATQAGVAPIDWAAFAELAPNQPPFFSRFTQAAKAAGSAQAPKPAQDFDLSGLREAGPAERPARLSAFLREQVANVLRLPAAEVDLRQPLNRLGLDSLMAVELRNRLRQHLAVDMPLVRFMEDNSISDLAAELAEAVEPEPPKPREVPPTLDADALLAQLDDLTEDQLDALLNLALADKTEEAQ